MSELNLVRASRVMGKTGLSARSSVYAQVSSGILPPPIKIGARASAWIEREIDAVIAARIAGKSQGEIRTLVKDLIAKRGDIFSGLAA